MVKKSQNQISKEPFKSNSTPLTSPSIRACFFVSPHKILQIKLKLAKEFSYVIEGQPTDQLKNQIDEWIASYLKRQPTKKLPLHFKALSPFTQAIYDHLAKLPFGKTLSYAQLACQAGYLNAYRAAGSALKNNSFPLVLPCHRILPKSQVLGRFNGGSEIKKRLLQFEGAFFKPNS